MSREVCGICWCPYDEETGECACKVPSDCADSHQPVAWIHTDPDMPRVKFLEWRENEPGYRGDWIKTPLFTAPPQRPAEPVQEPVAWLWPHQLAELKEWKNEGNIRAWSGRHYKPDGVIPVYAAPPQPEERHFCPRCGKRTQDIHTCTPP